MIHEDVQRDFTEALVRYVGSDDKAVVDAGLRLLDAGWNELEIMKFINTVYQAGVRWG